MSLHIKIAGEYKKASKISVKGGDFLDVSKVCVKMNGVYIEGDDVNPVIENAKPFTALTWVVDSYMATGVNSTRGHDVSSTIDVVPGWKVNWIFTHAIGYIFIQFKTNSESTTATIPPGYNYIDIIDGRDLTKVATYTAAELGSYGAALIKGPIGQLVAGVTYYLRLRV